MTTIAVRCDGIRDEGWICAVTLREGAREISTHRVRVHPSDVDRLAPGADDPTVRRQLEGNICRCTGYQGIVEAIIDGSAKMAAAKA